MDHKRPSGSLGDGGNTIPGNAARDPSGPLQITLQDAVTERVAAEQREILFIREQTLSLVWLHAILNLRIRALDENP